MSHNCVSAITQPSRTSLTLGLDPQSVRIRSSPNFVCKSRSWSRPTPTSWAKIGSGKGLRRLNITASSCCANRAAVATRTSHHSHDRERMSGSVAVGELVAAGEEGTEVVEYPSGAFLSPLDAVEAVEVDALFRVGQARPVGVGLHRDRGQ